MARSKLNIPLNRNDEYTDSNSVSFINREIERITQAIRAIDTMHQDPAETERPDYKERRGRAFTRRLYLEAALRGYRKRLLILESEIRLGEINIEPENFESALYVLHQFLHRRRDELSADEYRAYVATHMWLRAEEVLP